MKTATLKLVKGRVIRGEGQGRRFGYPTANLDRRYYRTHPVAKGVYAGYAFYKQREYQCLVVIGAPYRSIKKRPTKIEIHLLSFRGSLRGARLEAKLIKKIRPLKIYASQDALLKQIRNDIKQAKNIFHHYLKKHV